MKLEGSLDAFSLPDVFQLLSLTKKSGGLHLAHDAADGVVFFSAGKITGASADNARQALARRLIGSGVLDDDALQAAVGRAGESEGVGVVKALLDAGAVDAELLRGAVTEQVVDAVFDLLRWKSGDFAFVIDEQNPDDVGVGLAAESVLADAEARRETWETASQVVPAPTAVLTMAVVLPEDPAVSRSEWALLALVDGRRTVSDLVDLAGCGQYAVVSTLAGLVQRSLLEVRDEGEDHVSVVVRRQKLLAQLEDVPVNAPVGPPAAAPASEPGPTGSEVAAAAPEPEAWPQHTGVPEQAEAPEADQVAEPAPLQQTAEDAAPAAQDAPLVEASASAGPPMLGGAHVPGDVVPPRSEPFLPKRQPEYAERAQAATPRPTGQPTPGAAGGDTVGATALEAHPSLIERDPSVNRSLMLRLIAGVRGL